MGIQLRLKGAQRTAPPTFRPMSIVAKRSPISSTGENLSILVEAIKQEVNTVKIIDIVSSMSVCFRGMIIAEH